MEQPTTQFADQGVSLPNKDERSIKESAIVQALYAKFEGHWIGLKLSPSLLLGMLEGKKEEEE